VVPQVDLQMTVLESLGVGVDEIYFGTCVKKATALMNCPMNVDGVTKVLEEKFGVPVHMGTHDY
jgi:predicted metal-binding protein